LQKKTLLAVLSGLSTKILKGLNATLTIERRALMKTGQPLSDIAYACGFRDYTHFARGFRRRFGTAPGAVGAGTTDNDSARV